MHGEFNAITEVVAIVQSKGEISGGMCFVLISPIFPCAVINVCNGFVHVSCVN